MRKVIKWQKIKITCCSIVIFKFSRNMYSPNNFAVTFKFENVNVNINQFLCFFCFFSKLRENKKTAELIKTANLLFNSFEPYYMWDYVARWFEECCRYVKLFYSF